MNVRIKVVVASLLGAMTLVAPSLALAEEQPVHRFDLPEQPLAEALRAIARQTGANVLFDSRHLSGIRIKELKGQLTTAEAIERVLEGTELRIQRPTPTTVIVQPASTDNTASSVPPGSHQSVRLAQSNASASDRRSDEASASRQAESPGDPRRTVELEEIVVTAQKRVERLIDVPVSVTALQPHALAQANLSRLEDYYSRVPAVISAPGVQGNNLIAIRGLVTGGGNPTAGVVIDDVPFGGSTGLSGGFIIPDLDPSDLARIEVLRGPQGTLYGASSMGGLLKFVTAEPSTEAFSGRIQAGSSVVRYSDEIGHSLRGAINVPLSETLAVRGSAFTRRDPGYVDDPGLGQEDVNTGSVKGGRLAALWSPSDTLELSLSAMLQNSEADASSDVFRALPGLQQSYALPGLGGYSRDIQVYAARATLDLGKAELTLLTGYNVNELRSSLDYTPLFGTIAPYRDDLRAEKFTQEGRLSVSLGSNVDWLVGLFYADEQSRWRQRVLAYDTATGTEGGDLIQVYFPTSLEEYAAFTNVTVRLSERFDIQLGARGSHNEQTYDETRTGSLLAGATVVAPSRSSEDDAFTYLFTPRYRLSPNVMVYGRFASGYRPGGPNTSIVPGAPSQYDADTTHSYDLGIKGTLAEGAVTFESSLYYIDWRDFQLTLVTPLGGYNANGGRARSTGVELSFDWRVSSALTISAWGAYNEAELADPFPTDSPLAGDSGDRLPFSSRFSANIASEYEFTINNTLEAFAGFTVAYVDRRLSYFASDSAPADRQVLPSYVKVDVATGVRLNGWNATVYVNNLTDDRGLLAGGIGAFNPAAFTYIQPRTAGLSIAKTF